MGYQIRLESCVSPKTCLTFCTYGVLLRSLMGGDAILASLTHVIIDEVHERDAMSDFLVTVLRDALARHRGLRLILMSATVSAYGINMMICSVPNIHFRWTLSSCWPIFQGPNTSVWEATCSLWSSSIWRTSSRPLAIAAGR